MILRFQRASLRACSLASLTTLSCIISLGRSFGTNAPAAWAQGGAPQAPAATAPDAAPAPTIVRRTLPSGLRVILAQKRDTPLVALDVRVRGAGPATETPETNGVAHFIEHLVFKGSEAQKPGDIDAAIEALGGELSARTTRDATQFATVVPAKSWREATAIIAQMTLRPAFRAQDVEAERSVILQETATAQAEPLRDGLSRLAAAVYAPDSAYRLPLMGSDTNIRALALDDLRAYWRAHYTLSQMTLTIVGDVSAADAFAAAETLFPATNEAAPGAVASAEVPPAVVVAPPPATTERPALVIPPATVRPAEVRATPAPNKGVAQSSDTASPSSSPLIGGGTGLPIETPAAPPSSVRRSLVTVLIGFRGPSVASAPGEVAVMDVLLPLLATGGGDGGALGAPLIRNGTALSVTADFLPQQGAPGLFFIAATGRPGDAKRMEDALVAQLTRVSREGFEEDEIARARQSARGARSYAEGAVETWATRLSLHDVWGASDYDDKLTARTEAATDDALRSALRRYLNPQNRFVVVVGAPVVAVPTPADAAPSPSTAPTNAPFSAGRGSAK